MSLELKRLMSFGDGRGKLVVVESGHEALDFDIRRIFYIHGVPTGEVRGQHAHRKVHQLMMAVAGKLDVLLDDGQERRHVTLDEPGVALPIPALTWCEMSNFAPGTVCLVLASDVYDEADYIRDYDAFRRAVGRGTVSGRGRRTDLVAYDEGFLDRSWDWLSDSELRALTLTPVFTRAAQAAWFASLPGRSDYLIWGVTVDGLPVGACGIKNIARGESATSGEYWGYIGERDHWGRGVGTAMLTAIISRARDLQLSHLWLRVSVANTRAIRLYQKLGFAHVDELDDLAKMELTL